ncbi:MAG: ankyrin repeat domain-containing protein [Promethearchaeota archaeon]
MVKNLTAMLFDAVSKGELERVKGLISQGVDVNSNNDNCDQTALHVAVHVGFLDIVKALVAAGADILAMDCVDMTPLHIAARDGHYEIIEYLLSNATGSIPERVLRDVMTVASMTTTGDPRIYPLVQKFLIKSVKPTVGGDGDLADGKLIESAERGDLKGVKIALEQGANVEATDGRGMTALIWAALRGHEAVVRELLNAGADVNGTNAANWTPLMEASLEGHLKIVKILLNAGADVNARTVVSGTALMFAAGRGHTEIVKTLLNGGIDPNICIEGDGDDDGMTALDYAIQNRHFEIARIIDAHTKEK